MVYGIAAVFGPTIASKMREATGSYSLAFTISIVMDIVGMLLTLWYMKRVSQPKELETGLIGE